MTGTPLVAEQRTDKNGRVTTRYVRPDGKAPAASRAIPAPSLKQPAAATTKKKPSKRQSDAVFRFFYNPEQPDAGVAAACRSHLSVDFADLSQFEASDVEMYEVLSVLEPRNAVPVLAAGIRTAGDARRFLTRHKLTELEIDRAALMGEALRRGVPAKHLIGFLKLYGTTDNLERDTFLDAVEAYGIKALREARVRHNPGGIPEMVLHGRISLADIKTIGATRLTAEDHLSIGPVGFLERIRAGKSRLSVAQVAEIMQRVNPKRSANPALSADSALWDAEKLGPELVLSFGDTQQMLGLYRSLQYRGYDEARIPDLLTWADRLNSLLDRRRPDAKDMIMFHEAGVSPEDTADGLNRGLTNQQIIGIAEGVAAPVSDGWL